MLKCIDASQVLAVGKKENLKAFEVLESIDGGQARAVGKVESLEVL